MSAQLCVSSTTDSHETGMLFARDVMVDVCFVQLAGAPTVATAFGGLIYKIVILRPKLVAAIIAFAASLVSCLVTDTGIVH